MTKSVRSGLVEGYTLRSGEPITNTTRVSDLVSEPRWWEQLIGISLGGNFIGGAGSVFLPNEQSVVSVNGDGDVRFPVYGEAETLADFWKLIDAMSADGALYPEVPADSTSSIMNPAEFAARRLFGMSAIAVFVDASSVDDLELFFARMRFLNSAAPSGSVILLFLSQLIQDTSHLSIQTEEPTVAFGIGGMVSSSAPTPGTETVKFSLSRTAIRRF